MRRLDPVEPIVMLATIVQWLVLAVAVGSLVGVACSLFLRVLFNTEGRVYAVPWWLLASLLIGAGLANGLLFRWWGPRTPGALDDEPITAVNNQGGRMPLGRLWLKPVAAVITLSCGGSAGKEGPCSHLGAGVGSALGQLLHLNTELRKRLVACGVSAGFASVFGTPIAGAIYGVEMLAIGRIRHDFLFPGVVAGVTAYEVSRRLGVPYPDYQISFLSSATELLFLKAVLVGIICGLAASWFIELIRGVRFGFARLQHRFRMWPPLMPALGGCMLALCMLVVPADYLGLSLPVMEQALSGQLMPYTGFLWKILLVALTLGSGFYGGIVTPQFVIGAVAGGAFGSLLGMHPAQGAAVGMVAVVAAASNTPIAAVFMGVELFGGGATLYVAGACAAAYIMVGHRSVYPDQELAYTKSAWIVAVPGVPVGQEKLGLAYGLLRWWGRHLRWLDRGLQRLRGQHGRRR